MGKLMDDYRSALKRISSLMLEIDKHKTDAIKNTANIYRQVSEAICKAIILSENKQPAGNLEKLIAEAKEIISARENKRDCDIFVASIRYLQTIGNSYSHDGSASHFLENDGQNEALNTLYKITRIVFYGNGDIEPPIMPDFLRVKFPLRLLHRGTFENLRVEEVVSLWFPKQKIQTKFKSADYESKKYYDYVEVEITPGLIVGLVFLRERSSLEKSIVDFKNKCQTFPSQLYIITPRVYRADNREVDRKKSIEELTVTHFNGKEVIVEYFDSFVWDKCLPKSTNSLPKRHINRERIIPQSIIPDIKSVTHNEDTHVSAQLYIKNLLTTAKEYNPIQIFTGPAGIGKTTFCDDIRDYINDQEKKKVVFLSATDFRDISCTERVSSVVDLYNLALKLQVLEENIEAHNFEINLGCGNFVLIIDGFDELESHLGESLDFNSFISSLSDLEECFRNLLVIMTVRDYNIERFDAFKQITVCRIRGFSVEDTNSYLAGRLTEEKVFQAQSLLKKFGTDKQGNKEKTIPLYASLICDYLLDGPTDVNISSANSFTSGEALDELVLSIINMEIAKQSLGDISQDDFFDLLIEVIGQPQSSITVENLAELVASCGGNSRALNPQNFLRNPFLLWNGFLISFKYDSLVYFFKSRFLANKLKCGEFNGAHQAQFMAECYRGEGALYDELKKIMVPSKHVNDEKLKCWFRSLVKKRESVSDELIWRKVVSAFFYLAVESLADKSDRRDVISEFYGSSTWEYFSIFGKFVPLDLTGVTLINGLFENYINISNCTFSGTPVFYSCTVNFDNMSAPHKLDRNLFADGCKLSENVIGSFREKENMEQNASEITIENIYRVIKVGFRANAFIWKSDSIYRKVYIIGRRTLDEYLQSLCHHGIMVKEASHTGNEFGYIVSDRFRGDARKLIENKKITKAISLVLRDLSE